jgi:hypothetical protein
MSRNVLALGLHPAFADFSQMPGLSPELILSYVNTQLERLREAGYVVDSCLVDAGETAEEVAAGHLAARRFDCVLIGAGLRDARHLLLFEKLINLVHAAAPDAKICFNSNPADSVDAVKRWI